MAPATRQPGAKKGAAVSDKNAPKAAAQRKSVDGDGCWDVEGNEALDCFEFVGAKGAAARQGEGGSETAVLRGKYAGQWRTILGEQCYMTGVHYLAVRVEGHSRNGLPATDIGSSWVVGVGSRNCPLDGDLSDLAYIEFNPALGRMCTVGPSSCGWPKLWALGFSNYIAQPFGAGKVMAAPASIIRPPPSSGKGKRGGGGPWVHPEEPVALLAHSSRMQNGDILGMRLDVDAGTVGFWVNRKHVKDVQLNVDCASWVALASSSDPRVKFSLLTKGEQRDAKLWDVEARQEIEEAAVAGSKVLGAAGRKAEGQVRLRDTDAQSCMRVGPMVWGLALKVSSRV
jgi:hypothetical protein